MLADVGMVKTYSKSAHVNDLVFAWTGPSCCMDRLAPLFAWTGPLPCSHVFPPGGFVLQVHTAPSLHLPLFLEETFYTPFALMVSSSQGKERFVLPSIGETARYH